MRGRGRRDRVVDVVDAGQRHLQRLRPGGRVQVDRRAAETIHLDLARRDLRLWSPPIALGAEIVTEVRVEAHVIHEVGGAPWTLPRISAVLKPPLAPANIFETVVKDRIA